MENTQLEEALNYFSQPGFKRIFEGLGKRYISLGRVGGTVVLHSLTEVERDVLEGFFQTDCHHKKSMTISVEKIEKALQKTKFSDLGFEKIFHGYFPKELISKQEQEECRREQAKQNYEKILEGYEDTKAGQWFVHMLETKTGAYPLLHQDEEKHTGWTLENIPYVLRALNALPVWNGDKQRLPVFASAVTGNPHYFDETNRTFRYLLYGICDLCNIPYPKNQNAEIKAELLYRAGILKDDISSNVTCIGIRGYVSLGRIHEGIEGFWKLGEMVQLNLQHLGKLEAVEGVGGIAYVVENPSIFQKLAEETKGKFCVVCSNGQIRLAVLVLLDFLVSSGCLIRYSGDFDPEGLMIAQKLKKRYGEKLEFWHYSREDYEKAVSKEEISEKRLRQLEHITCAPLQELGDQMKRKRFAGYQENIWEEFVIGGDENE